MNKILIGIVFTLLLLFVCGLPYKINVTHYKIPKNTKKKLKIGVIADLHCRTYGHKQKKIIDILKKENVDLVIIPGDLFDVGRKYEYSFDLVDGLKGIPTFFSSGNHDTYLKQMEEFRTKLKEKGVTVLEDTETITNINGQEIEIVGCCDHGRNMLYTAKQLSDMFHTNSLRILISHRPEFMDVYQDVNCDLIVCGHAHGGQWRIPFTHQGIYAPRVGFLPKYTEGIHNFGNTNVVISRGLASGNPYIPRLYNNPEIVIVEIQ